MKLVEAQELSIVLDTIKLVSFSVEELKKILSIKRETKKLIEETNELKIEVMKKYDIQNVNGGYQFEKHSKAAEITKEIGEIDKGPYILASEINFITFEQLKTALKDDHTANTLEILDNYLVKK